MDGSSTQNSSQTGSDEESPKSKEQHLSLAVPKSPAVITSKPTSRKRRVGSHSLILTHGQS